MKWILANQFLRDRFFPLTLKFFTFKHFYSNKKLLEPPILIFKGFLEGHEGQIPILQKILQKTNDAEMNFASFIFCDISCKIVIWPSWPSKKPLKIRIGGSNSFLF